MLWSMTVQKANSKVSYHLAGLITALALHYAELGSFRSIDADRRARRNGMNAHEPEEYISRSESGRKYSRANRLSRSLRSRLLPIAASRVSKTPLIDPICYMHRARGSAHTISELCVWN